MAIRVHRDFAVHGSEQQFERFLSRLDEELPRGWSRRRAADLGSRYHIFERGSDARIPAASLFLSERDGRLVVANIIPESVNSLSIDEYNTILGEFATIARSIAGDLELRIDESGPDADIGRWLSDRTQKALVHFSRLANKSTGSSHPMDFERWADFITVSHREGRIPPDMLARFLVEEEGWPPDRAAELVSEYEFGLSLLDRSERREP